MLQEQSRQLELFPKVGVGAPVAVATHLRARSGRVVDLRFTRNRVAMISLRFSLDGSARIRLHEGFLAASVTVLDHLGDYIRTRRTEHWKAVARFARGLALTPAVEGSGGRVTLNPVGRIYNLELIADEVNRGHFNGRLAYRIGWGRVGARRHRVRTRTIRFGSWSPSSRVIRIHPALDDRDIPEEFVRYIVFHELLHAAVPVDASGARHVVHSRTFRHLERGYPNLAEMKAISHALVRRLVRLSS
jgi:hypothetical protein